MFENVALESGAIARLKASTSITVTYYSKTYRKYLGFTSYELSNEILISLITNLIKDLFVIDTDCCD